MKTKTRVKIKIMASLSLLMILIGNLQISNAGKISIAYLYGNYDYLSLVKRTEKSLNVVSPSYFDLDSNGNLVLNTIDINLVSNMHANNIRVTPFLSNHWDREKGRAALDNREKLSNDLVNAINKYNLDGINVDIENVTEVDKEKYTDLVRLLREKLPADKEVSVAVAANPYDLKIGWQGSYDYSELAKYADYLMIMAYDEHYEGGVAGPVASVNFIDESIKYALSKTTSDKIVVGLPFYGRYWKNGSNKGGYGVTLKKIENMIQKYESNVTFDESTQTAKAVVKIKAGDIKPSISGRTLYEGTYTFYYENSESIKKKIELIEKYNLKGIGCWSLGQETNDVWTKYSSYLGNDDTEFVDIDNVKWAKSSIEFIKEKGWINGRGNNYYEPNEKLTRAEFATIVCRILNLDTSYSNEVLYFDTNNHWAKSAINALTKTGILEGYEDKSFRPDEKISREEATKILSSLVGSKESILIKNRFSDVFEGMWSYQYIMQMVSKGAITGYEDGTFKPKKEITRAEIAVILERMYK